MAQIRRHWTMQTGGECAIDILAQVPDVSKAKLKDALNKGAVQLQRKGRIQRLRRATTLLQVGDILRLYYDPALLMLEPPLPVLIADLQRYSIWYKPPGLLAQGNEWGDHCSLLRQAELYFSGKRPVLLVHRLDREAGGLMLIAHDSNMAASLGLLFQKQAIEKLYQIRVRGLLPESGVIDSPLDGKSALTRFTRQAIARDGKTSYASVQIESGRKHQIRRHFESIDHPVMGDPVYGTHNQDAKGLQLVAVSIRFLCPMTRSVRDWRLDTDYCLFPM